MGRFAAILVVGFAIVAGIMKLNYHQIGSGSQNLSSEQYNHFTARNAAISTSELCLYYLSLNKDYRGSYIGFDLTNCIVDASIIDATKDASLGTDTVRVAITSAAADQTVGLQVLVALNSLAYPSPIDAGITARCDVKTLGTLIVDGRNHDWYGNMLTNDGVKAIVTTQDLTRMGNSTLGGTTDGGWDQAPSRFNTHLVSEEYAWWGGGYPATPDAVLRIPDGTLKSLAVNGVNGGQYVQDPANLNFPLQGVTYVELPDGGEWRPVDFNTDSKGILVVHNDERNALMQELNMGEFKGLIIADDVMHLHNTIYGAIFILTAGPAAGNCIGNGTGHLMFCKDAIMTAINESGVKGDSLSVISYYE